MPITKGTPMTDTALRPTPNRASTTPEPATDTTVTNATNVADERSTTRGHRAAGVAGLVWFALLVVTNIANGAVAPAPDATVDEVVAHLTDDRAVIYLVTAGFAFGCPFVIWFFSGLADVLRRGGRTQAAFAGMLAVAAIFTMFGITATTRLALVAAVETDAVDDSTVWAIWKFHDVAFATNAVVIAAALLVFALGGAAVGLLPRWIRPVSIVGGGIMLFSGTFLALPMAEGTAAAMAPSFVGFALWLVFVATASVALIRRNT